jgi:hypothetical protein
MFSKFFQSVEIVPMEVPLIMNRTQLMKEKVVSETGIWHPKNPEDEDEQEDRESKACLPHKHFA